MMEKEKFNPAQIEIICFSTKDVICTSDPYEVFPEQGGGGELPDP